MTTIAIIPALEELQSQDQWVCWKLEPGKKGRLTKVPYNPQNGRKAEADNPSTWTSHENATRIVTRYPEEYAGVGYEFDPGRGITGIDLDHCIDENGNVDAWAQEIINFLNSYAEKSPSETGVHILVHGLLPEIEKEDKKGNIVKTRPGTKRGKAGQRDPQAAIEMYCQGRFFTVTGKHLPGTPETIEERQTQLLTLHEQITAKSQPKQKQPTTRRIAQPLTLSDSELLDKALSAKNSTKFQALWHGNTSGYPSDSEADEALCWMLAFWTQGDTGRIDRLFRQSALYREDKWDRAARSGETYGEGTIRLAIQGCTTFYNPIRNLEQQITKLLAEMERIIEGRKHQEAQNNDQPTKKRCIQPREVDDEKVLECLGQNEWGDALLFAEIFEGTVLYDCTERAWYEWHTHYWKKDQIGHVKQLVSGYLGAIYLNANKRLNIELAEVEDEIRTRSKASLTDKSVDALKTEAKEKEALMKALNERAKALRGAKRCANVLSFAQTDDRISVTGEVWDSNPWQLATIDGVIDLRTGECRDGQPDDYIRTVAPTAWKGLYKDCPRFLQFLNEIFDDRPARERTELISFLQRLLGYAITGLTREHIFPILYGEEGRNGKDTLLALIKTVLGPVAGAISNDVLIAADKWRSGGSATPHLVDLQGKRIVWGSETKQGDKLNVAQIKLLTGGGEISARPLYGQQYTFKPTHTLLLITNYKPHADARDKAFWTRACLIEFNTRFVEKPKPGTNERKADESLKEKLEEERSGILAWLVRGCLEWQQQGLNRPETIELATDKYRQSEDRLQSFVDECCYIWDTKAKIKASVLYQTYQDWCKESGLSAMNNTLFGIDMGKKYPKERETEGICYHGIRLRSVTDAIKDPRPAMYSSENATKPYIDHETASQADRVTVEENSHVGYVGFSQQVPLNSLEAGLTRGLSGKTIHTLHNDCDDSTADAPVEPTYRTMYSLEDSTNPTCETAQVLLDELAEMQCDLVIQEGQMILRVPEDWTDERFNEVGLRVEAMGGPLRKLIAS